MDHMVRCDFLGGRAAEIPYQFYFFGKVIVHGRIIFSSKILKIQRSGKCFLETNILSSTCRTIPFSYFCKIPFRTFMKAKKMVAVLLFIVPFLTMAQQEKEVIFTVDGE